MNGSSRNCERRVFSSVESGTRGAPRADKEANIRSYSVSEKKADEEKSVEVEVNATAD